MLHTLVYDLQTFGPAGVALFPTTYSLSMDNSFDLDCDADKQGLHCGGNVSHLR